MNVNVIVTVIATEREDVKGKEVVHPVVADVLDPVIAMKMIRTPKGWIELGEIRKTFIWR